MFVTQAVRYATIWQGRLKFLSTSQFLSGRLVRIGCVGLFVENIINLADPTGISVCCNSTCLTLEIICENENDSSRT